MNSPMQLVMNAGLQAPSATLPSSCQVENQLYNFNMLSKKGFRWPLEWHPLDVITGFPWHGARKHRVPFWMFRKQRLRHGPRGTA